MRIILILFVFAFKLVKADIEPHYFYEFIVYKSDGDSVKGYSDYPVYEYSGNDQRDTLEFFIQRSHYTLYKGNIGDTSKTQEIYSHHNNIKIASVDIDSIRFLKHFTTSAYYDFEVPILESDSVWSNELPDTIIELPYDEMFTYYYCIHDYLGAHHDLFKKLASYGEKIRKSTYGYFEYVPDNELSKEEQIERQKENTKIWIDLKEMMERIKEFDKVVIIYNGSC